MEIWLQLLVVAAVGFLGYCIGYVKGMTKSVREFNQSIKYVDAIMGLLGIPIAQGQQQKEVKSVRK